MSRPALVAALLVMAAGPAAAQNGREHFVQPDTAYDAVHAVQRDAFTVLRDSTATISAAGSRLMSDLTSTSSLIWMRGRARAVAQACARSEAPLANARAVTVSGSWPLALQKQAQSNLLKEMTAFKSELASCQKKWTALAADTSQVSLRESAPYEMKQLQDQVDRFNRAAQHYLQYISVKLDPPAPPKS